MVMSKKVSLNPPLDGAFGFVGAGVGFRARIGLKSIKQTELFVGYAETPNDPLNRFESTTI